MNEIVSLITANPVLVLTDEKQYSEFYKVMKAEVEAHVPDISTEKGRKEIASLAYKVARTKTAIDAAGKKLNEDARAQINTVDASRRKIRDELDALSAQARKPLTEWEQAEEDRIKSITDWFTDLGLNSITSMDDTAESIGKKLAWVEALEPVKALFGDQYDRAVSSLNSSLASLSRAKTEAEKREADALELERLRRAAQEREAAELAAAKAKLEQEQAEGRKRQDEARAAAEAEARKEAQRIAVEIEAERVREEERAKHAAELKAEQDKSAAAERAVEQENRRRQEQEAAAHAEAERIRREETARQADRDHRGKVMGEAKAGLLSLELTEADAKRVVLAIVANEIPHVSLRF